MTGGTVFEEVGVGAGAQGFHDGAFLAADGEDQQLHGRAGGAQSADGLDRGEHRHGEVEDGDIRVEGGDHLDGGAAIGDLPEDAHPMGGAEGGDAFPHNGMVVGEYHSRCCQFLHETPSVPRRTGRLPFQREGYRVAMEARMLRFYREWGDGNHQFRAIGATFHIQSAVQVVGGFAYRPQTDAGEDARRSGERALDIEAHAIILDGESEFAVAEPQGGGVEDLPGRWFGWIRVPAGGLRTGGVRGIPRPARCAGTKSGPGGWRAKAVGGERWHPTNNRDFRSEEHTSELQS